MMAGPQRSTSMVFVTFVLLGIVALIVLVLGIVGWKDGDDQGAILFGAGAVSLILTIGMYPIASALDKHRDTIKKDWRLARAWLRRELGKGGDELVGREGTPRSD